MLAYNFIGPTRGTNENDINYDCPRTVDSNRSQKMKIPNISNKNLLIEVYLKQYWISIC